MKGNFLFDINFYDRQICYIFDMTKPELFCANTFMAPLYTPLSKEDIKLIMTGLIDDGLWNVLIGYFKWWMSTDENYELDNGNKLYPEESLKEIPPIPPDYNLIWNNGYTGKEDYLFVSYDYWP
jgi:hypothetical protein